MPSPSTRHIEPLLPTGAATSQVIFVTDIPTLTLVAIAPAILAPKTLAVSAVQIALTAHEPTLLSPKTLTVSATTLLLTAVAPTVTVGVVMLAVPPAVLTLTAIAPAISAPGGPISVPSATLVLTAHAPAVLASITQNVPAATVILTAHAPTAQASITLGVPVALITVTAYAPTVQGAITRAISAVTLVLTAHAPFVITGTEIIWFKAGPAGPSPPTRVAAVINLITVANYPVGSVFVFEAMIRTVTPSRPCYCRLFNRTAGLDVAGSMVQTDQAIPTRVRSGALSLSGADEYEIEFGGQSGAPTDLRTWHNAKVIVIP